MKTTPVPVNLITTIGDPSEIECQRILKKRAVIASVEIITSKASYPCIYEGRLVFPVGRFHTHLATPEFKLALNSGAIKKVSQMAVYDRAKIFDEFVDYFYNRRLEFKERGDKVNDFFCKIILNSLYGKFGQSGRVFETVGKAEFDNIRTGVEYDVNTGEETNYREYAGIRQEQKREAESRDSFPAIAATITSAARVHIGELLALAGRKNTYYMDTDSLLVNRNGFGKLFHLVDNNKLGGLKLALETTSTEIRACKDYIMGDIERIKGVRPTAIKLYESAYKQDQFPTFKGLIRRGDISTMVIRTVIKHLTREYKKGTVMGSGEVKPLILSQP